jgi:hypothetical protein
MTYVTAECGCEIYVEIWGGCFGFHQEDDYCECDPPYAESAKIEDACDKHRGE